MLAVLASIQLDFYLNNYITLRLISISMIFHMYVACNPAGIFEYNAFPSESNIQISLWWFLSNDHMGIASHFATCGARRNLVGLINFLLHFIALLFCGCQRLSRFHKKLIVLMQSGGGGALKEIFQSLGWREAHSSWRKTEQVWEMKKMRGT